MGRESRERRERIQAGLEQSRVRAAVEKIGRAGIVHELSKGSVGEQSDRLDSLRGTGELPASKLKKSLMKNAPREMDTAIKKFRKKGKPVTVGTLCAEIKNSPEFLRMCANAGLTIKWFENLARERMEAHGL